MTRQQVENDRYIEGQRMSRNDHAVKHIITLQYLTPPLQEDEIVQIIADQHNRTVRERIRHHKINNIDALLDLLNGKDAEDQHDRLQGRYNGETSRRNADHMRNGPYNDGRHYRPPSNHGYQDNRYRRGGGAADESRYTRQMNTTAPPGGDYTNYQRKQTQVSFPNVNNNNDLTYGRRAYQKDNRYDNRAPYNYRPVENKDNKRSHNDYPRYPTPEQKRACAILLQNKDTPEIAKEKGNEKETADHNRQSHFLGGAASRPNK